MKTAIFLANGFEEIEAITVIDVLRRGGFSIDTISISNDYEVKGTHDIKIIADKIFSHVDFKDYQILILPGGMPGTTNLLNHEELCKLLVDFNKEGKTIGAICAAPIVLGKLNILYEKEGTCYPGLEDKLIGCKVVDDKVVLSKNIITAKGAGASFDFAFKILSLKMKEEEIRDLKKKMILL